MCVNTYMLVSFDSENCEQKVQFIGSLIQRKLISGFSKEPVLIPSCIPALPSQKSPISCLCSPNLPVEGLGKQTPARHLWLSELSETHTTMQLYEERLQLL